MSKACYRHIDNMHGLSTYDYGARQHDPILGRWDRIDPLCEKYYSTSPYAYCRNNPVIRIDVDGCYDVDTINHYSPVVAIFPANYKEDVVVVKDENGKPVKDESGKIVTLPGALQDDHKAAMNAGVNVICVEDISDAVNALRHLAELGIQCSVVTINSHGTSDHFYMGAQMVSIRNLTDCQALESVFDGKEVFIGACNVGQNEMLVQGFSALTNSTTIASTQQVAGGYRYDGSYTFNMPYIYTSCYKVCTPIDDTNLSNFGIHKYTGTVYPNKKKW